MMSGMEKLGTRERGAEVDVWKRLYRSGDKK